MQPPEGILNVRKPVGMTSHDVVSRVRRITKVKRVGHSGTLDPFASGVLPVFVGQATRVIEYMSNVRKTYEGTIVLGISTDSYDIEGNIVAERPVQNSLTQADVERVLDSFRGEIIQVPPRYSAVKVGGQRLYQHARAGREVEIPERRVFVHHLAVHCFRPPCLKISAEVSRGTYIRSLANDIGEALGCGGYLQSLVRTKDGPFSIVDAIELDDLEEAVDLDCWDRVAYAADTVLADLPAVILSSNAVRDVRQGKDWAPEASLAAEQGDLIRAYSTDGELVAILKKVAGETWHPDKVFQWNRSDDEDLS